MGGSPEKHTARPLNYLTTCGEPPGINLNKALTLPKTLLGNVTAFSIHSRV